MVAKSPGYWEREIPPTSSPDHRPNIRFWLIETATLSSKKYLFFSSSPRSTYFTVLPRDVRTLVSMYL